jgi:hypothetical protein
MFMSVYIMWMQDALVCERKLPSCYSLYIASVYGNMNHEYA